MSIATAFQFQNEFELPARLKVTLGTDISFELSITNPEINDERKRSPQTLKTTRSFMFRIPSFLSPNWSIVESTQSPEMPVYYATIHPLSLTQPDVVLHSGPDKSGSVLGVSRFRFSRHILLGFGDLQRDADSVTWEQMRNTSWWRWEMKYRFDLKVGRDEATDFSLDLREGHITRRRKFSWEHTRSTADGIDSWVGKLACRNFKLSDVENGNVVAVFLMTHWSSFMELGELRIHQDVEEESEVAIVLTCASINRMTNKRR